MKYRNKVEFDLDIRKPVTQIYGDSATGKSLLAKCVKNSKIDIKRNSEPDDLYNVIVFDDEFTINDLENLCNMLIIIDRADIILNDELLRYIRTDRNNHYLIFARSTLNLGLSTNYYGRFVYDDSGKIYINYDFSERGWF